MSSSQSALDDAIASMNMAKAKVGGTAVQETQPETTSATTEKQAENVPVIPLDDPVLPVMPADVLPSWLNRMALAVANHTETPLELAAGFGLAVVATCVQQRVMIEVEPDYTEPVNVWPITALESGNRKTAVMKQMVAPLIEAERTRCEAMKEQIAIVESERETIKAKLKALRTEAAEGGFEDFEDKKQEIAKLETSMPDLPAMPRLWVQDITPEKLGMVMAENGERLTILSDEGGLFDILAGRYSNGIPNLDVFLQAHAGASVRVHRGSRSDVVMDQPALTIALSPQPDVLKGLAGHPGFRGRGLLARFLYALPPSQLGYRHLKSQPIPPNILTTYREKIETLLKLDPVKDGSGRSKPYILALSADARVEWKAFQHAVEKEMREDGKYQHMQDWAGKLPGAAARIAGLFHCADHPNTLPSNLTITPDTMNRALSLAAFYTRHALAAFNMMGADLDLEKARRVWRWVMREKKTTFTARDCFQAQRGSYPRMEQLNPAFAVLLERGYLIEPEPPLESTGKPGRKKRIFHVNPDALKVHP